jgi:hypothetical protein
MPEQKLQVKIGPSIEHLQVADVNSDENPHFIDSPYFVGNILIRIKNFNGITPNNLPPSKSEKYFENKKRLFSIQFTGRFKHVRELVI